MVKTAQKKLTRRREHIGEERQVGEENIPIDIRDDHIENTADVAQNAGIAVKHLQVRNFVQRGIVARVFHAPLVDVK